MAIPKYNEIILPFLEVLSDEKEYPLKELVDILGMKFNLTDEELSETLKKSGQNKFYSRVGWARTYLNAAKLIDVPRKAVFKINQRGKQTLIDKPENILNYLKQFDEFLEFLNKYKEENPSKSGTDCEDKTPEEMIEYAQDIYYNKLKNELLDKLKGTNPYYFEKIVLTLMEKMNYGVGELTKKSRDGGIDGIIDEDELGLEKIYIQAKRYTENKVNEKEIQNFAGALATSPVNKGVFITTSSFDEKAIKKAGNILGKTIRLIDGDKLSELMIKHNVGVQIKSTIKIKKLDEDFFTDDSFI